MTLNFHKFLSNVKRGNQVLMIANFKRMKKNGQPAYILKPLAETQIKMQLGQTKNTITESGFRLERVLLFEKLCVVV